MNSKYRSTMLAMALVLTCATAPHAAAVPDGISYQAYLTNADGTAVNTNVTITFALYNVDAGGVPLWSQTEAVTVDQGLFTVALANPVNPFPAGLFDGPVYMGMFVAGEEMLPRREMTSTAFSFKAADADTLNGVQASTLDQSADVATLQGDVAGLDTRVSNIETNGGDITGVSVGTGLTGGGSAGDVVVSVAAGGINVSHLAVNSVGGAAIANGSVGSADIGAGAVNATHYAPESIQASHIASGAVGPSEIADGAVGPVQIDESDSYNFAGVDVSGTTTLRGPVNIESPNDIRIHDDFNGLRWYDGTGTTQRLYITSNSNTNVMFDSNQNRNIFLSNTTGIAIGTPTTTTGYGVTVPSINVLGNVGVGLERVTASYIMSSTSTACHAHGNLACYWGSGTVSCPVGKRVIGGGALGSTPRFGAMGSSYPNSNTSWSCSTSYDLANITRTCYAICARMD